MELPLATAITTTERAARRRRRRIARLAGLIAAGALFGLYLVVPVPLRAVELLPHLRCLDGGLPPEGVSRAGGVRAWWIPGPLGHDRAVLRRRFADRGLAAIVRTRSRVVTVEIPGAGEGDVARAAQLLRGAGRVAIREVGDDGTLGEVLFDGEQLIGVADTQLRLLRHPVIAFSTTAPVGEQARRADRRRVAVTVDGVVRWRPLLLAPRGLRLIVDTERDAETLLGTLDDGGARGGTLVGAVYVPPADLSRLIWTARIAIALLGGVAVSILARLGLGALARLERAR